MNTYSFLPLPATATMMLLSISMDLPVLNILSKWNHPCLCIKTHLLGKVPVKTLWLNVPEQTGLQGHDRKCMASDLPLLSALAPSAGELTGDLGYLKLC